MNFVKTDDWLIIKADDEALVNEVWNMALEKAIKMLEFKDYGIKEIIPAIRGLKK